MNIRVVVALFIVMLILALSLVKWKFRLIGFINLISPNIGCYTVRFFGIPIHYGKFQVYGNDIFVSLKNSKRKKLTLNITDKGSVSVFSFLDNAFFLIADITRLDYFFKAGNSRDACLTALACAQLKVLSGALDGIIRARYPKISGISGVDADFTDDIIQLSFSGVFYMTLLEIVYGIVYAVRRTLRLNKRLRKNGATKKQYLFGLKRF